MELDRDRWTELVREALDLERMLGGCAPAPQDASLLDALHALSAAVAADCLPHGDDAWRALALLRKAAVRMRRLADTRAA